MARLSARSALWAIIITLCAAPLTAQTQTPPQSPGCDSPVAQNTASSSPCTPLAEAIAALLNTPATTRDHWGISVIALDGAPIYSLNDGQLFQPASNAKLFTTSAAMALLGPQTVYQTKVLAQGTLTSEGVLTGNLTLIGAGDANISASVLPYMSPSELQKFPPPLADPLRYLEQMADQIASTGLRSISGDILGDDTIFPWQPYAPDWAIDDAVWGYGAPVSALTINDNQIKVTVAPGLSIGAPATVTLNPTIPYYTLDASVTTGAPKSGSIVQFDRAPGSRLLRIYGTIALHAKPDAEEIAIQDPAEYAAIALKQMLEVRGITVTGKAKPRHRILLDLEGFHHESSQPLNTPQQISPQQIIDPPDDPTFTAALSSGQEKIMATHTSPPLQQDVVATNKDSQNLHAELLLRQLGAARGRDGTIAQGARVVRQFLLTAGIDPEDFAFFDGSGLSGHDLVTPRATARLLQYATSQPWFTDWKASLPIGGVDGTLDSRFTKPPLQGKVIAKTGTLGEARALSGYLECASGRTVIFSIMVGNHLPQSHADRDVTDKIVAAIAAAN